MSDVWTIIWNAFNGLWNTVVERFQSNLGFFWLMFGVFIAGAAIRFFVYPFLKGGIGAASDGVKRMTTKEKKDK